MQKKKLYEKLIKAMKITIAQMFLAICFMSIGYAHTAHAQGDLNQRIYLQSQGESLSNVLKQIEQQTKIRFVFSSKLIQSNQKVNATFAGDPLSSVLDNLLQPRQLQYKVVDKVIVLKKLEDSKTSMTSPLPPTSVEKIELVPAFIVTGVVVDEKDEPLVGASVVLKGTTKGAITDVNGNYKLELTDADKNGTLVISFVGYEMREIDIAKQNLINVRLASGKALEEVVVVGYGEIKKSDLTGSVAVLKTEGNEDKPITSIDQLIQGRVSGVQLTQNTGAPGSSMSFLIRGAGSVSGSNQPLIILDGYPIETDQRSLTPNGAPDQWSSSIPPTNPLAAINPNDIESIEILKDASATAIYGSRGANGVVMITTKRGKLKKDQFSYSFRMDISRLPSTIDVLNTADFIDFANEGAINSKRDSIYKAAVIPDLLSKNYDWQSLIFQEAVSKDHQVSFTGGDEKTKYSVSGNYFSQAGIVKNSQFDRGSIRINLDRQVLPKLKLMGSFSGSISENKSTQQSNSNGDQSGSVVTGALRFRPTISPFTAGTDDEPDLSVEGNPLTLVSLGKNISRSDVILTNMKADYAIIKGLNLIVNSGVNNTHAKRDNFQPFGTFAGRLNGYAYNGESTNFNFLFESTLNFNRTIAGKHRINAVGGYTWQQWNSRNFAVQVTNFVSEAAGFNNFSLASTSSIPSTSNQNWALESVLGRFNYSFDNRYLFTFTGRSDGSSRLAEGHKWAFFPSFATGWNVHNEPFMKNQKLIDELKIRASYGLTGNQSVGVGASVNRIGVVRTVINSTTIVPALAPTSLGNPELGWETTRQANIGIDIGLFKNRFSFSFEAYNRRTSDLLVNLTIPSSTGYGSYSANLGEVENKGIELSANAVVLPGNFKWTTSGNISFNRNKLVSLGNGIQLFGSNYLGVGSIGLNQPANTALAGYPIGAFFGYKAIGVYQNADEIANSPKDATNPTPGDIKYADTNGDGQITLADRTILGNPYPDFTFGFTNDFRWKSFTLNIFVMGNIGQGVMNLNRHILDALTFTTQTNMRKEAWDGRWRGEGTSNYYPQARNTGSAFRGRMSDFYLEDGSFVRLKNVSFAYNLPSKTIKWLSGAKVFVSATNLLRWTKYKGYDPEVSANPTSALSPGIDFGTVPQYRTYSTGINVVF